MAITVVCMIDRHMNICCGSVVSLRRCIVTCLPFTHLCICLKALCCLALVSRCSAHVEWAVPSTVPHHTTPAAVLLEMDQQPGQKMCNNMVCPYQGGICCNDGHHCCPSMAKCLPDGACLSISHTAPAPSLQPSAAAANSLSPLTNGHPEVSPHP